jgi:predicted tellurium resistance membrane protein TerC
MRSLVAVNCVIGLLLIAFGGSLEQPMNSFPSVAMVLLGILCWVSAVVGLLAGHKYACCLSVFLVMHGFNILMQVGAPDFRSCSNSPSMHCPSVHTAIKHGA